MLFSPFLALRYLQPKRTFVSIITLISILGVALGVWLLTVVIAVFTGYGETIKDNILGFEPHLVVDSGGIMRDFGTTLEKIDSVEGIESSTPYVRGQVIMDFEGLRSAPMVRGILQPEGKNLERMQGKIALIPDETDPEKKVPWGEFDISDPYSAVIGDGIARGQGISVGDKILLYSPGNITRIMDSIDLAENGKTEAERKKGMEEAITAPQELTVTGIFDSGHWDFDSTIIFCHLETAQVLYEFDLDEAHGIAIRTDDGFKADQYQKSLEKILGVEYRVLTWMQMHQLIFNAVAAERQAMYLILFMIMIVSAFTIMNTMITVTYQKRPEIGLLKALGARERQIAWVFLFQGMLVGLIGVIAGMALAELTIAYRNFLSEWVGATFGVDMFSAEIYKIDGGLPAKQTLRDMTIISVGSFIACTVAALIPALIAASLQPAKALRSE